MLFGNAISELAFLVNKKRDDTDVEGKLKFAVNAAKIIVSKSYHWKELKSYGELVLIPNHTSGTVSITLDSRTVNGSGTDWTSAMVGRFFQHSQTSAYYRIINVVSATQLILQSPIVEATASALTYLIRKRFYRVNSDIRLVLPDEKSDAMEVPFTIEGYDLNDTDYSAGTVSVTADSNILTGVGTSFLDNVHPGDLINLQSYKYTVRTVDSDTQITMNNRAMETFPGGAYFIKSESPIQAEIFTAPSQKAVQPFFYIRHLYDMVHDNDSNELSNKFDRTFMDWAKAEFERSVNAPGWQANILMAQGRLNTLKQNADLVWYPYRTFPPRVLAGNGRGQ